MRYRYKTSIRMFCLLAIASLAFVQKINKEIVYHSYLSLNLSANTMMDKGFIDEKQCLLQLKRGNRTAFEQLYRQYAQRLMVKLLQLVKSEEIAQDLLQDIFLNVWEMREKLDAEKSFGALLYKMAANVSYNAYRSAVREQNRLQRIGSSESYTHIEEDIAFQNTHKLLEDALATLTVRQREVYTLHRLQGKSYQEISEILEISHSAINQHLQLATKHIRAFMRAHLPHLLFFLVSTWMERL